jgi:hypothetical protein
MDNTTTPEAVPLSDAEHAAVQAAYAARPTVCTPCGKTWANAEDFRAHVCEVSGVAPTDPAYLGEDFAAISEAALQRGADASQVQG